MLELISEFWKVEFCIEAQLLMNASANLWILIFGLGLRSYVLRNASTNILVLESRFFIEAHFLMNASANLLSLALKFSLGMQQMRNASAYILILEIRAAWERVAENSICCAIIKSAKRSIQNYPEQKSEFVFFYPDVEKNYPEIFPATYPRSRL